MKKVNLKNINTNNIIGPYIILESYEDIIEYGEKVLQKKAVSAFEYLLTVNVASDKLDHVLDAKRSDYGEQIGIYYFNKLHDGGLIGAGVSLVEEKLMGMFRGFDKLGALRVNHLGGWCGFDDSNYVITDELIEEKSGLINVQQANCIYSEMNENNILILENAFVLSNEFSKKLNFLFSYKEGQDFIFNFKNIDDLQLKVFIERVQNYYDTICFDSDFYFKDQLFKFLKLFISIKKPLKFYIKTNVDINKILVDQFGEDVLVKISHHTINII